MTNTVKRAIENVAPREIVTQTGNPSQVVALAPGGKYQGMAAANRMT
jgi:hypothetical protein